MKPPPFARVPTRAASAGLSCGALRVLIVICSHADKKTGQAFPSTSRIACEASLDRRSVHRAIAKLIDARLLTVEQRRDRAGDSDTNLYTVLFQAEVAAPAPPPRGASAAGVVAKEYQKVVAPAPPKQSHITDHLTRARDGSPPDGRRRPRVEPDAPVYIPDDETLRRLREKGFRERGIWLPQWGERPDREAVAA
jgi:hypothetical protein